MLFEEGQHVLFVCEGSAEQYVLSTLIERGELTIPQDRIVKSPITGRWFLTRRESIDQAERFLGVSYGDRPLLIIRIADSTSDRFRIPRGYEHTAQVVDLNTKPEIEMLVIIHEGQYGRYTNGSPRLKPSDYCKTTLGMPRVKSRTWLERYWSTPGDLEHALREYARLHRFHKNENRGLVELLR